MLAEPLEPLSQDRTDIRRKQSVQEREELSEPGEASEEVFLALLPVLAVNWLGVGEKLFERVNL